MENLLNNQEPPLLVTISFIVMTLVFDLTLIVYGEMRKKSLLESKGSKCVNGVQGVQGVTQGAVETIDKKNGLV